MLLRAIVPVAKIHIQTVVHSGNRTILVNHIFSIKRLVGLLAGILENVGDLWGAMGDTVWPFVDFLDRNLDQLTKAIIWLLRWFGFGPVIDLLEIMLVSILWGVCDVKFD